MEQVAKSNTLHGIVIVTVGDREYTLTPTLGAARKIEARFGGLRAALDGLSMVSADTAAWIIASGANLKPKKMETLPQQVFEAGTVEVVNQCVPFIHNLMRPAPPKDEGEGEEEGEEDAAKNE